MSFLEHRSSLAIQSLRGCCCSAVCIFRAGFKSGVLLFRPAPTLAPVAGTALERARGQTDWASLRQGKCGAHVGLEDATPHQSAARCGTMKGCR